jgi:hypothetical protein
MGKTWARIWMPSNRLLPGLSSICASLWLPPTVWSGILRYENLSLAHHTVLRKELSVSLTKL